MDQALRKAAGKDVDEWVDRWLVVRAEIVPALNAATKFRMSRDNLAINRLVQSAERR